MLPDYLAPRAVNSPTRITSENNGKILPQPGREKRFARASGGGSGSGIERSLGCNALIYNDAVFLNPFSSDLGGEHRAEPVPPKPHRLVADIDTPFMQ